MDLIAQWQSLPSRVARFAEAGPLDELVGPERFGLTRRQVIHHLAEAQIVAASILIAGLGSPGSTYDWSWMMPFGPWLTRLDYANKPVEPSLRLLEALNAYVVAQVAPLVDGLGREVLLKDAPDAELRRVTVADVLRQEIEHVEEHVPA